MKILKEQPDLNRKFVIEMSLGELLSIRDIIEENCCYKRIPVKDRHEFSEMYKSITGVLGL